MRSRSVVALAFLGIVGCTTDLVTHGSTDPSTETTPVFTTPASSAEPLGAPIKSLPSSAPPADAGLEASDPVLVTPDAGTPPVTAPPPPAAVTLPSGKLPLRGVHLAGAEFGEPLPGVEDYDYVWPTADEVDYFLARGMNTFRIGFMWERVQARAYADFEHPYFDKLDALTRYATAKGAYVVLDPHNFARYYDDVIGSANCPNEVFADFWRRMATLYGRNPNVVFDLVNEPHDLPTEQWVSAANAAIAAIRGAGAGNLIEVPGNAWTGAYTWNNDDYGTPNAVAMLNIVDPANNVVFEAHQYLDSDGGGESYACTSKTVGTQRLQPFLDWLRQNGKRGVLGEFAGGRNKTCKAAIGDMLATIDASSDVLVGWTWWAAGPGWDSDYQFSIEPDANGNDAAQMSWLAPYLVR